MIKEILPLKYRKFFLNCFVFNISLGISISLVFFVDFVRNYWRFVFLLQGILDIPKYLLLLLYFKLESPKWMYEKFSHEKSEKKIEK